MDLGEPINRVEWHKNVCVSNDIFPFSLCIVYSNTASVFFGTVYLLSYINRHLVI